ncbi:unnamed protein product [Rotaria magnacalcarata]|nr:unnamed protein product [Rotaria magnacalcarata]CAF1429483.1 unnamed protein product [Rotaria magnacalcarata]CAF2156179.1 unnamed protein product [Rotaria magnacalcarata]CAF2238543.1 unnamed protein product [Rotaria magnacalcarata]CAF3804962.1 unnamed protein product [Rotaria magnacalcarata]
MSLIAALIGGIALATVLTLYIEQSTTQLNLTNATAQAYYCGGTSSYTLWQVYATSGITMLISTVNCSFNSTPLYFTSMDGSNNQWFAGGYTAIYSPATVSFRVYARALTNWTYMDMLNNSQLYQWNINWFGISN